MRSFSKHIVSDAKVINNDIIGFSGTQTNTSDSTCIITMKINFSVYLTDIEIILLFYINLMLMEYLPLFSRNMILPVKS